MQYQLLNGKNVADNLTLQELKITEQGRGDGWMNCLKTGVGFFKISELI